MSTTLGGVTLPDPVAGPEGCRRTAIDVGGKDTMADGSIRIDDIGTRLRFDLAWRGLSSGQRDTLWTRYGVRTVQTFSPPEDATSYNVLIIGNTWKEGSQRTASGFIYEVEFAVEEQAAS
jgi:hypothetical protein